MEKLMDLYRSIQNPLNDIEKLRTIIRAYSDSKKNKQSFFSTVLHWNSNDKKNSGTYNPYIEDVIDYWKVTTWKDNIIQMTPEKYAKFYRSEEGYYSEEFTMLQRYLKQIDGTVSKENFEEIKEKMRNDDRLKNAYEKYDYEIFQRGWDYVSSTNLFESEPFNVQHRLYINCDSVSKYDVIIKVIDDFTKNNIPMFFKHNDGSRDDTIVLWTDDENLLRTVNMLKAIKEKIPSRTCLEPTILAGTIDGWLGYGSEPTTLLNGEKTSFNEVRTKVIKDAIENVYSQYVSLHPNAKGLSEFEIAERDSEFIQAIRNETIRIGKEHGIDENNFCFDTQTFQRMKQMDSSVSNTALEIDEEPDLEELLRELYQIEEKYQKRENPGKKKEIKRDKRYYQNAESYLKGLINLTPEQRKRGNQYLSTLEQDKNPNRGDN